MAKKKRPEQKPRGPHLAAALFCQTTLEDKDGPLSAIRIVDQFNFVIDPCAPEDFPSENLRLPVELNALLSFRTGDSPGDHALRLLLEYPDGRSKTIFDGTISFGPTPHGGKNLRIPIMMGAKESGLHWIHVFLDRRRITSMPFQISISRAEPTTEGQPADGACAPRK